MDYKTGKQTLTALVLAVILVLVSSCKKDKGPDSITDGDGNDYTTVTIGTQVWLTSNIKSLTLNDGTDITGVTLSTEWKGLTTPAYCYYDNAAVNKEQYGVLYNWYVVNTNKLCPDGFHVPTRDEWNTLRSTLGTNAGGAMKSTSIWDAPNTGATNSSGFSALPGGCRMDNDAALFYYKGEQAVFWCATQTGIGNADAFYVEYNNSTLQNYDYSKTLGASVRCIKD